MVVCLIRGRRCMVSIICLCQVFKLESNSILEVNPILDTKRIHMDKLHRCKYIRTGHLCHSQACFRKLAWGTTRVNKISTTKLQEFEKVSLENQPKICSLASQKAGKNHEITVVRPSDSTISYILEVKKTPKSHPGTVLQATSSILKTFRMCLNNHKGIFLR